MDHPSTRLTEISEDAAQGRVAELYDDIRRVTGVPTVALVYRALAVDATSLDTIWTSLAPNLADGQVRAAAEALNVTLRERVPPLPARVVSVDRVAATVTIASFDRSNRLNVLGLTALLDGVEAPSPTGPPAPDRDPLKRGLTMAELGSLPHRTIELLEEMSVPVAGGEEPVLIPSLYRFFAADHDLLAALWESIRPVVTSKELTHAAAGLGARVREAAVDLPYGVPRLAPGASRVIVERFLVTIPAMIVVTRLIGDALRSER